ncbi:MAG: hypothetical protein GX608_08660 [Lentisphaerae bacterium]|nr:hypothetical protein [Lentisphaerota bacterium]
MLRSRHLTSVVVGSGVPLESSTWSLGSPHDVAVFLPVHFGGARAVFQSRAEVDPRLWKNPSFNRVVARTNLPPSYKAANALVPAHWSLSGATVDLEMVPQGVQAEDYFVKMKSGTLYQHYGPWARESSPNRFQINFRAKGRGEVEALVFVYTHAPHKHLRSDSAGKVTLDSDDWAHYRLDYEKPDAGVSISGAMRCNSGEVCIDDVFFTGAEKPK